MGQREIMQWVILGIIVAFIALERAAKFYHKKNSKNPGHGERIATLEEAVDTMKSDIEKIFKEIRDLWKK